MKTKKLVILTYHKVNGSKGSGISKRLFAFQMILAKILFKPVRLVDGIELIKSSDCRQHYISITFDDGYKCSYNNSKDILNFLGIRPTMFISSGYLGKKGMWNDFVKDKEKISEIKYSNLEFRKNLINFNSYLEENSDILERAELYKVSMDFDIGGHTLDHPILILEDVDTVNYQIRMDKINLEKSINSSIDVFAYPNGKFNKDFDIKNVDAVRKNSYKYACTTSNYEYNPDINDDFLIPRISAPESGYFKTLRFFIGLKTKRNYKKVLFAESGGGFGGATLAMKEMLENLPEYKNYLPVLTLKTLKGPYTIFSNIKNLIITNEMKIDWTTSNKSFSSLVGLAFRLTFNTISAAKTIIKVNPDLIYLNNDPYNNLHFIIAAKLLNKKYIIHHRGHITNSKIFSYSCNNALLNIGISNFIIECLKETNQKNNKLIYDGVNEIKKGSHVRSKQNIVMVGGFYGWKGQQTLLEAIKIILPDFPELVCNFVGFTEQGNQLEKKFKSNILEYNLSKNVFCHAFSTDISRFYNEAAIVVHASTMPEPFGRVIIESMSSGCITISSGLGCPKEIIKNGWNGFLFKPGDATDLAEKIIYVLKNIDEMEHILLNGLDTAARFTPEINALNISTTIENFI